MLAYQLQTQLNILNNARALLLRPDGWTQGRLLYNARTSMSMFTSCMYAYNTVPSYMQVCAVGSVEIAIIWLRRTAYSGVLHDLVEAHLSVVQRLEDIACEMYHQYFNETDIEVTLAAVNDHLGLPDVLCIFDRAILECAEALRMAQAEGLLIA
jgi:hypothetical protein